MHHSTEYAQWILFGDSITQRSFQPGGLGQILANTYQRKLDIVNRGYDGYNTTWALHLVPDVVAELYTRRTKAVCLWWGANDCAIPGQKESVSLEQFKANLLAMITAFRQKDASGEVPTIFVLSPTPINIEQRMEEWRMRFGLDVRPDHTEDRTRAFATATQEVAEAANALFVPVYDAMLQAAGNNRDAGLRKLLSDGKHLSPAGYEVVATALFDVLRQSAPSLDVQCMTAVHPDWSDVNVDNPGAVFSSRKALRAS